MSLNVEINACIGKADTVMAKLNKRVGQNINLIMNTRLKVYQARVTAYSFMEVKHGHPTFRHEAKLNSFHLRCLRRILGIPWQDRIPNTTVLEKAKCSSIHALLSQRCLRWLRHMQDGNRKNSKGPTASLKRVHVKLAVHSFASKMFARGI